MLTKIHFSSNFCLIPNNCFAFVLIAKIQSSSNFCLIPHSRKNGFLVYILSFYVCDVEPSYPWLYKPTLSIQANWRLRPWTCPETDQSINQLRNVNSNLCRKIMYLLNFYAPCFSLSRNLVKYLGKL